MINGLFRRPAHWVVSALLCLGVLGGCTSLDEQQRKWIFQPSKQTWWASQSVEGVQDVWIEFDSRQTRAAARLHGLWLPAEHADAPVLLYLHGARWDVTGSTARLRRMRELGFSVLGIDYRGFGKSTDELPSEQTAYEDARVAWQWLARQHPQAPRYIFGHSLGSAIAVQLASEVEDAKGVILEGSFTSIAAVFQTFKWGWLPVSALITQRFDAGERIVNVKAPILIVHGSNDSLIRPELGRALFERAVGPKRFVLVEGGSHYNTNALGQSLYRESMRDLFGL
jgi:alpha-beta hydrolase superfamily lysophospholipase